VTSGSEAPGGLCWVGGKDGLLPQTARLNFTGVLMTKATLLILSLALFALGWWFAFNWSFASGFNLPAFAAWGASFVTLAFGANEHNYY
jgi:hypothetical protein